MYLLKPKLLTRMVENWRVVSLRHVGRVELEKRRAYSGDSTTGDHEIEHEDGEPPRLRVTEGFEELISFPYFGLRGVLEFFRPQGCERALFFIEEVCGVWGVGEKEP